MPLPATVPTPARHFCPAILCPHLYRTVLLPPHLLRPPTTHTTHTHTSHLGSCLRTFLATMQTCPCTTSLRGGCCAIPNLYLLPHLHSHFQHTARPPPTHHAARTPLYSLCHPSTPTFAHPVAPHPPSLPPLPHTLPPRAPFATPHMPHAAPTTHPYWAPHTRTCHTLPASLAHLPLPAFLFGCGAPNFPWDLDLTCQFLPLSSATPHRHHPSSTGAVTHFCTFKTHCPLPHTHTLPCLPDTACHLFLHLTFASPTTHTLTLQLFSGTHLAPLLPLHTHHTHFCALHLPTPCTPHTLALTLCADLSGSKTAANARTSGAHCRYVAGRWRRQKATTRSAGCEGRRNAQTFTGALRAARWHLCHPRDSVTPRLFT